MEELGACGVVARTDSMYSFENTENSEIRRMSEYWFSICDGKPMPQISDFDTIKFPENTPWMAIVEVLDEGADFLFRLVGTKVARIFDGDLTGKRLSQGMRDHVEARLSYIYGDVVNSQGPVWGGGRVGNVGGRRGFHSEACLLPLADESGNLVRIVHMIQLRADDGLWLS